MLLQNILQPKIIMIRFMLHLFKLFIIILQKAGGQMYCLTCDLTWSDLFANLKTPASLFVCASMHNLQHIFPQIIKKKSVQISRKKGVQRQLYKKDLFDRTFRTQGPFSVCLPCGPAMLSRQKSSRDPPVGLWIFWLNH